MAIRSLSQPGELPNPDLQLKPGMFVNIGINLPMGRQLVVPASAVLQSGTREIVFVDRGDGYLDPRIEQVRPPATADIV